MPNKKKKYNARFPPARIKKIMQTDEDVGKVAAAVPVIISRALELFIESLIMKASRTTQTRHAKTLTTAHIKQTIEAEKKFDFLRDLVVNIADHQTEEESEGNSYPLSEPSGKKLARTTVGGSRGPRKRKDSLTTTSPSSSDGNNIRRSKHLEEEEDDEDEDNSNNNNNNNNDDDDNNEETDEADSEEEDRHSHGYQNQNNKPEDVEATTSSFLRGDEEKTVPSSNGFTPTTSAIPKCHTLGQPTQQQPSPQFKVPALFSSTPLSTLFLPPGHSQGQEEDDDYDT